MSGKGKSREEQKNEKHQIRNKLRKVYIHKPTFKSDIFCFLTKSDLHSNSKFEELITSKTLK